MRIRGRRRGVLLDLVDGRLGLGSGLSDRSDVLGRLTHIAEVRHKSAQEQKGADSPRNPAASLFVAKLSMGLKNRMPVFLLFLE